MNLSKFHKIILSIVSAIGLFIINSMFIYSLLLRSDLITNAYDNLFAMTFMLEAFILLPLFCLLIHAAKLKSPDWKVFLLFSLGGSLAFSIPFSILLWNRNNTFSISGDMKWSK
jgi:hypothetical protein